jgi:hypothetical protein
MKYFILIFILTLFFIVGSTPFAMSISLPELVLRMEDELRCYTYPVSYNEIDKLVQNGVVCHITGDIVKEVDTKVRGFIDCFTSNTILSQPNKCLTLLD